MTAMSSSTAVPTGRGLGRAPGFPQSKWRDEPGNEYQDRISEIRKTLLAPGLRLENDWSFLSRYTTCVRELFSVKRVFITLIKEENIVEMFDPEEPHSVCMDVNDGLCAHALRTPNGVFSVSDLDADERYADIPSRGNCLEGSILRFYAGKSTSLSAALVIEPQSDDLSRRIGVLCILDDVPHDFSESDLLRLKSITDLLSGQIVQQIEEQNAHRQARMHRAIISFMNSSLHSLDLEDSGNSNTSRVHLPTGYSWHRGSEIGEENISPDRLMPFFTPRPTDQKIETVLYRDALATICHMLDQSSAALLDLSRYDVPATTLMSPDATSRPSAPSESGSESASRCVSYPTPPLLSRTKSGRRGSKEGKRSWCSVAEYAHPSCENAPFDFDGPRALASVDEVIERVLNGEDLWFPDSTHEEDDRCRILHNISPNAASMLVLPVARGRHSLLLLISWPETPTRPRDIIEFVTGILSSLVNALATRDSRRTERAQLTFSNVQAHELRTPMHQIMSSASLLRAELMESPGFELASNGVITDLLDNLEVANTQLERNISSILGYFSTLAINQTSTEGQNISDALPTKTLGQVLESSIPPLIQQCNSTRHRDGLAGHVDVVVDFVKPYLADDVFEDTDGSLARIIESFFINALIFRRAFNSWVKITVDDETHLLPTLSGHRNYNQVNVSIKIEDNGIGMADAFLQQFYFQAMAKQDEFSSGTGLSVYLAQELLHLMDGRIAVSSTPGKGTVVLFEVPLSYKTAKSKPMTHGVAPFSSRLVNFSVFSLTGPSSPSAPFSCLEHSLHRKLLSLGLPTSSSWSQAELLIAPGNLSPANIHHIASTFGGKEVWTTGSEYGEESWAAVADKFSTCHLGSFIVTTAISQLLAPTSWTSDAPNTMISPPSTFMPNFSLTPSRPINPLGMPLTPQLTTNDFNLATCPKSADLYIMVVDDNLINRKILAQYVKDLGAQVMQAEDGAVAVELFRNNPTRRAIILLDINMPGLNGYDASVQIRDIEKSEGRAPSYIVAVTALGRSDQRDRGLNECGMNEWITKPVARRVIVKEVTAGKDYLAALDADSKNDQ